MVYAAVPAIPENREIRSRLEQIHGDWKRMKCPRCGKRCYRNAIADDAERRGMVLVCASCAVQAGKEQKEELTCY